MSFFIIIFSLSHIPTAHAEFADLAGKHWAKQYVNSLVSLGIVKGYEDNTFHPDSPLTRAEAVKIVTKAVKLKPKLVTESSFSDIQVDNPFISFIEAAKNKHWISGFNNGEFQPDRKITRAEFTKIFLNAADLTLGRPVQEASFSDVTLENEFAKYIYSALVYGFIGGYQDNTFKPRRSITRAEASKIIANFLKTSTATASFPEATHQEIIVYGLINKSRSDLGLPNLILDKQLSQIARSHSEDLAKHSKKTDHFGSDGSDPFDRLKINKVSYKNAAENVGWGTFRSREITDVLGALHQAMISQPKDEHNQRANIFSTYYDFKRIGIGIHADKESKELRLTEIFLNN